MYFLLLKRDRNQNVQSNGNHGKLAQNLMKQGGGKEQTVTLYFQGFVYAEGDKNNCQGNSKNYLKFILKLYVTEAKMQETLSLNL